MIEQVMQMVQGIDRLYPYNLEERYPHILNKIVELWETPQIDAYLSDLMISSRPGRQGFPSEVVTEIYRLSQILDRLRQESKPKTNSTSWDEIEFAEQRIILGSGFECSPKGLIKSVESGNHEVIYAFIKSGVNIDISDERGWTPLMISSFNGHEEIAQKLIASGANVHVQDTSGYRPIHWAAFNGYASVVKLLITKDADLNAQSNHGWTALMQAATRGHLTTCSALIAGGANVNLASLDGWTPLHKASANGHTEVVRLLLASKANASAEHQDGATPLSLATKNKHQSIIELLRSRI